MAPRAASRDDYHGWIRSWYVRETDAGEIAAYGAAAHAVVAANVGYVLSAPDERSLPVSEAVAGTRLVAGAAARRVSRGDASRREERIHAGGASRRRGPSAGARSRAPRASGRCASSGSRTCGAERRRRASTARGSCSGCFSWKECSLPRDSDRQALVGALDSEGRGRPSRRRGISSSSAKGAQVAHVAISVGGGSLHPRARRGEDQQPAAGDERYDEKFSKILLFARSVLR